MPWDSEWDDVVDVLCTDAGIAGLAGAIWAVDRDADVFVASTTGGSGRWFPASGDDVDTTQYLDELTADIDVSRLRQVGADLPARLVGARGGADRVVPPFVGSRLRDWAMRCIASPSGYLYTRLSDWHSTTIVSDGGEPFEVAEIGSLTGNVGEWLAAEARARDVVPQAVCECQRLVFEDGVVAGAVFATERGPLAIRAEHGVLICAGPSAESASPGPVPDHEVPRVALVGKAGSRFGRVELLTTGPALTADPK